MYIYCIRYVLNLGEGEVLEKVKGYASAMNTWIKRFIHKDPHPNMGKIDFKRYARTPTY